MIAITGVSVFARVTTLLSTVHTCKVKNSSHLERNGGKILWTLLVGSVTSRKYRESHSVMMANFVRGDGKSVYECV